MLDVKDQQEKIIVLLKKDLEQEEEKNEMVVLECDALLKKYHHPWVC